MRKVLSFVLVLALVLSSFSMAFAADSTTAAAGLTDIAGNANEDAIQVAYDLEIVTGNPDGTFLPDKTVTRAEFAAMITRALAIPDSALAGYTATTFKDTTGYGWAVPYLAFCQSKGIMLGDGAGNVMPGRTITVNEAMTMSLRAIGYTANSAMLVGAWPSNYVSIAQNEDLYDDVASDSVVTKASAAQIIYNLLTVQKVAVNSDGETKFLVSGSDEDPINLLNSNLGATEDPDVILGSSYDYDNSLINITGKIGAKGDAYLNDDDDLIAFKVESTALTGKRDGDKFKVGDTKYDIDLDSDVATGEAVTFANTVEKADIDKDITDIETFAQANADNNETVTLNVDLSGKKIKDIYSVVAWQADQDDQASADVQEDITDDQTLLDEEFVLDDDDNIDLTQFQLTGVASLADIAEDDVVYVYTDGDNIRKVAVGTETVEGTVDETDSDTVTIGGKDYDIAKVGGAGAASSDALKLNIPSDVDVDSDGTFYLDNSGKVYAFDGSGNADTFAVVKAGYVGGDAYDDAKVKLYLSDDSSKTFNFSEDDLYDLDVTHSSTIQSIAVPETPAGNANIQAALATGSVIGYALNSDGEIKALDITADYGNVQVKSSKVLRFEGRDFTIKSDAAVFTWDATENGALGRKGGNYDVASVSDLKTMTTTGSTLTGPGIIVNDDDDVVAIFLPDTATESDSDDVYGVFNHMTSTHNADGDSVSRYTGYIDGATFSKLSDEDTAGTDVTSNRVHQFGVYKIKVDTNDVITDINSLEGTLNTDEMAGDNESGQIFGSDNGTVNHGAYVITGFDDNKSIVKTAYGSFTIDEDAIIYKYDGSGGNEKITPVKRSNLDEEDTIALYDTKGDDADGTATVVIFIEH